MRTLFDSSALIAHLRGEPQATSLLLATATEDRLASVLSRAEIEGGMRSAERARVASLFGVLTLLPVTDPIAGRAGEYLREHRRFHPGIDLLHYLVAAPAALQGARLATLNVRHFPMLKGREPPW